MRALKITALILLLVAALVTVTLAWLVRSEQGSRWLLQQGLEFSPVTIEASGISGTLADGLGVDRLFIALPVVEIKAEGIIFFLKEIRKSIRQLIIGQIRVFVGD